MNFTRRYLTLDTVWWLLVPLFPLMRLNISPVPPNDFWWHVRTGQIILHEWHIPTADLFSFTRYGDPWVNQAWLMQIGLYALYKLGGLPLIVLACALVITAGYVALLRVVARYDGLRPGVCATLLGSIMGMMTWIPRPQVISYLLFGTVMALIESHRHGRTRLLWWVLPLFVIWVNSHGGFVFGVGVLGLYVVGRLWEFWRAGMPATERSNVTQLAAVGLLSLTALSLNPQGPIGIARYVAGFLQSEATVNYNQEFSALSIRDLDGKLFWTFNLCLATIVARSNFRLRADQVLSCLVFATLSLTASRTAPWYGYVMIPVLAAGLQTWWKRPRLSSSGAPLMNGLIVGLMGVCVATTLPSVRCRLPLSPERRQVADAARTPVAATNFLCARLPENARIYGFQPFNSYQIWGCPRLRVFIDTRFELYPLDQWLDYLAIEKGRFDWERVADKYQVTHLFLSPRLQKQVTRAAAASSCWREIYRDDRAVVFEKACKAATTAGVEPTFGAGESAIKRSTSL
jgi:hypothetical protein